MAEHILSYSHTVVAPHGVRYRVSVHGERNELGTWNGWLVFRPESGDEPVLRTDRETTQPARDDLEYWASGLEPVYLDGAFGRASPA